MSELSDARKYACAECMKANRECDPIERGSKSIAEPSSRSNWKAPTVESEGEVGDENFHSLFDLEKGE